MNNNGNLVGLGIMAVAAVAVAAGSQPLYNAIQESRLKSAAGGEEIRTLTGQAEGYGGPISVTVTAAGDRIIDLEITGSDETPDIGGTAISSLRTAIVENQGLDGVDAVSGATWTSNGVFDAIRTAMGEAVEEDTALASQEEIQASELTHGLGFYSNGRLGPGSDDQGTGVYSFNEVVAYVLFDNEGTILDLEVDQLEVATPNYDGESMPGLTGFPGQSYNADEDHDAVVDTVLEQTEDSFLAQIDSWQTKRERGSSYKLNSGTWTDEMNIFENFFVGMTTEEVSQWFADYCSDVNGRPLFGASENEEDITKYEAFTDEEKSSLDAISGATMSLRDAHGDILGSIEKAWTNAKDTNITVGQ